MGVKMGVLATSYRRHAASAAGQNPAQTQGKMGIGREGIEPSTTGLKVRCSATELPAHQSLPDRVRTAGQRGRASAYRAPSPAVRQLQLASWRAFCTVGATDYAAAH